MKSTIDIYGRQFTIEEKPEIVVNGNADNAGMSCFDILKIEIKADLREELKNEILTHEVAHMAMCENGLADLYTDQQIESICNLCASVYRIMKQYEKE